MTVAVSVLTYGTGSGIAASMGVTSQAGLAASSAAFSSFASETAISVGSNNLKLDKVAKEVTSKQALRDTFKAALAAGAVEGIKGLTDLGKVSESTNIREHFKAGLQQATIRATVDSAVYGTDFGKNLLQQGGEALLATAQYGVGDIAVKHGLAEGSASKAFLHASVGGTYSAITTGKAAPGIIGGLTSELAPGKTSAQLSAATIAFLSGQSSKGIQVASKVAASGVENNFIPHAVAAATALGITVEEVMMLGGGVAAMAAHSAQDQQKDADLGSPKESSSGGGKKVQQAPAKAPASPMPEPDDFDGGKDRGDKKNTGKEGKNGVEKRQKSTEKPAKIHGNSHKNTKETHVYKIRDVKENKTYKVGESSMGIRKRDGKSVRSEVQKRQLERETGKDFDTEIIQKLNDKKSAHEYQHKLIKRYRSVYKKEKDILPGNKGNY